MELTPARRGEVLELAERVDEIVPLLPEAEFAATVRGAGIEEYGWLLEFATREQRVAAVDLDCWRGFRFSPSRFGEWLDALIAAGPETLAAAFDELDPELWVLALAEDETRSRTILETALDLAPHHYLWLLSAAAYGNATEAAETAAQWRHSRLADLGFPERGDAMRAYRPLSLEKLEVDELEVEKAEVEKAESTEAVLAEPQPEAGVPAAKATRQLPALFAGHPLGRALAQLSDERRGEVMRDVLGVANSLAVADKLPLVERGTVEQCLARAVRGIDRGLLETARANALPLSSVLHAVPALDLFRVGLGLEPSLRPHRSVADLAREDEDPSWDWNEIREMIADADSTIGPDGRPR